MIGLYKINENDINTIMHRGRYGFIVISIGKDIDENNRIYEHIKKSPYLYTPIFSISKDDQGVDNIPVPSYIIYNSIKGSTDIVPEFIKLLDYITELIKGFKQTSIYIHNPNDKYSTDISDMEFENYYHETPTTYFNRIKETSYGRVFLA